MALDYTQVSPTFPVRVCPSEPFSIRIMYCHLLNGTFTWNFGNNSAPFWRLYWNRTPGASVRLDGKETPLVPGKVYLIAPQTPFDKSTRCSVEHFHLHFYAGPLFDNGISREIFPIKLIPEVRSALNDIIALLEANTTDSRFLVKSGYVVSWALNMIFHRLPVTTTNNPRLARVLEFIDGNISEHIGNDTLAVLACMNTCAFIRYFKSECGVTPQNYITARRIEVACDLLHSPDMTIDQISEQCGFCDRNYFTTVFTKAKAISPAAYRRRISI